jgi:hypothetical protein
MIINVSSEGLLLATFLGKRSLFYERGNWYEIPFICSKQSSKENKPASVNNSESQVLPCGGAIITL